MKFDFDKLSELQTNLDEYMDKLGCVQKEGV